LNTVHNIYPGPAFSIPNLFNVIGFVAAIGAVTMVVDIIARSSYAFANAD
jgi:hypothetical protein